MKPKLIKGVPRQHSGGFHDTESLKHFEEALLHLKFEILTKRFFAVSKWKSYCGDAFADFNLYDASGTETQREPQKGDYMRIDIPGPGEREAKGYDWVEVTEICYDQDAFTESIRMTCRPSADPKIKNKGHIAHFYSSGATSTFIISRTSGYLKAAIYGRNETPNFKAGFIDILRNLMVAAGGIMGVSKIQWKQLADGFLDFD